MMRDSLAELHGIERRRRLGQRSVGARPDAGEHLGTRQSIFLGVHHPGHDVALQGIDTRIAGLPTSIDATPYLPARFL